MDDIFLSFCFVFGVLLESFGALGAALCALGAVLENYRFLKVGQEIPELRARGGVRVKWDIGGYSHKSLNTNC